MMQAIVDEPNNDLYRQIFADWLEENGKSDLDRATVEFIRVSCTGRDKPSSCAMVRAAYKWISDNWRRLIPTVLANNFGNDRLGYRRGRLIHLSLRLDRKNASPQFRNYSCILWYWKGFVLSYQAYASFSNNLLENTLRADQPIMFLKPVKQKRTPVCSDQTNLLSPSTFSLSPMQQ